MYRDSGGGDGKRRKKNMEKRVFLIVLDSFGIGAEPDAAAFGCLALCARAFAMGGTAPAALSAANEVAVYAFLEHRLPFLGIEALCTAMLDAHESIEAPTLQQILEADASARIIAARMVETGSWKTV